MGKLKETWGQFVQFAKSPQEPALEEIEAANASQKTGLLFRLVALDLLCMIPLMGLLSLLEHFELVNIDDHAFKDLMNYPKWAILLMVVVAAPVAEECLFRIHLARRWNPFSGIIELFATIGKGPEEKAMIVASLRQRWQQYYWITFYLTAAFFALVHLANFDSNAVPVWLAPVLIAPQFVTGIFLGYIRVKNGSVGWSMALHALHNAILIGPVLLVEMPTA